MIVKLLYLGMPFLVGVGMAITTYKILSSRPQKLGRKFAIIVLLTILSLGFFWLPKSHRITETIYPNGFRSVNEVDLEPRFFQKTAPLLGIIIGVALVQFKKN
jgi:hypothetical protein